MSRNARRLSRCRSCGTLLNHLKPLKSFPIQPLSPTWSPDLKYCDAVETPVARSGYKWLYFPLATSWVMQGSLREGNTFPMPIAKSDDTRDGYRYWWRLSVVFKLLPSKSIASTFFSRHGSLFWETASELVVSRWHLIPSRRSRRANVRGLLPARLIPQPT